jgi:hypothetical protein
MNWFSQTTSIAGIQVSNWIFVVVAVVALDYLLIRRTLKHAAKRTKAVGSGD